LSGCRPTAAPRSTAHLKNSPSMSAGSGRTPVQPASVRNHPKRRSVLDRAVGGDVPCGGAPAVRVRGHRRAVVPRVLGDRGAVADLVGAVRSLGDRVFRVRRRRSRRVVRLLYALSALMLSGRVRGRPGPMRGTRILSMTGLN
jgi:hypothetical protein